ncbi:MAG: META domain-containing protein [Alphaproteobacteria bacterium]
MKNVYYVIIIAIIAIIAFILFGFFSVSSGTGKELNETYILHSFDGNEIAIPADKAFPTLKFNATENTISGFAGCNNIRGNFNVTKNDIKFGPIASTKKACFHDIYEPQLLNALNKANSYQLKDGLLTLKDGDTVLVYLRLLNLN